MAGNRNGNESGDETSSDSDSSKSTYMSSGIDSEKEKKQEFLNYQSKLRLIESKKETKRLKKILRNTKRSSPLHVSLEEKISSEILVVNFIATKLA